MFQCANRRRNIYISKRNTRWEFNCVPLCHTYVVTPDQLFRVAPHVPNTYHNWLELGRKFRPYAGTILKLICCKDKKLHPTNYCLNQMFFIYAPFTQSHHFACNAASWHEQYIICYFTQYSATPHYKAINTDQELLQKVYVIGIATRWTCQWKVIYFIFQFR